MGRDFQQRVTQGAIHRKQLLKSPLIPVIDQVGLVQQQQRRDAGVLGGNQIPIDKVGVWLRQRRKDDHDQIDVGCHRLQLAATIGTAEFGVAWQLGNDDPNPLVAGAPDHLVAGYQRRQIGPQMTTENLSAQLAILCLDFYLYAEVGDDQAGLLRTQIATFQLLNRARFPAGSTRSAFFLDFLDAPVLPAVELAFGHLRGCPGWKSGDSSMGKFSAAGLQAAVYRLLDSAAFWIRCEGPDAGFVVHKTSRTAGTDQPAGRDTQHMAAAVAVGAVGRLDGYPDAGGRPAGFAGRADRAAARVAALVAADQPLLYAGAGADARAYAAALVVAVRFRRASTVELERLVGARTALSDRLGCRAGAAPAPGQAAGGLSLCRSGERAWRTIAASGQSFPARAFRRRRKRSARVPRVPRTLPVAAQLPRVFAQLLA